MVSGISLFDIIQLLSMSRSSKVIEVQFGNDKGVIYIEDGDIVHAEADGRSGEEVVYDCLSEENVTFNELPWRQVGERTIHKTTAYLMLEAARLKDEKGIGSGSPIENVRQAEMQKKAAGKREDLLISRVSQIRSVIGAVLVRRNGEVMAGAGEHINSVRTLSSLIVGVGEQLRELLQRSRMEMIVVNLADNKKMLIMDLKSALLCVHILEDGVVDLIKSGIIGILKGNG